MSTNPLHTYCVLIQDKDGVEWVVTYQARDEDRAVERALREEEHAESYRSVWRASPRKP